MQEADNKATVFQGKLMSPREMHESIAGSRLASTIPDSYRGRWYLCGDVSEELYQLAVAGNSPGYTLGAFSTPGGTIFAVFALQLQNRQARFLLPLITEKSQRFAEQIERTGLYLSLGRDGGRDALLVEFQCLPELFGSLRSYSKGIKNLPKDPCSRDFQIAGQFVRDLAGIPSIHSDVEVDEVCLTIVLD